MTAGFDTVLTALDTARRDSTGLDEVTSCLLVAAAHEELFYDVKTWGEDIGLASRTTFWWAKARLEEQGLIMTEAVLLARG